MLADAVGGDPIRYADAVLVASTGRIYFSDTSPRFAPSVGGDTFEASILNIVEQSSTGRILEYDRASKGVRVIARGLSFANGVALNKDEQSLFVTSRKRRTGSTCRACMLTGLAGYPAEMPCSRRPCSRRGRKSHARYFIQKISGIWTVGEKSDPASMS